MNPSGGEQPIQFPADERTQMWLDKRPNGYDQLQWVRERGLLDPIVTLSKDIKADLYVDLGTGTGAVLAALEPHHERAIGIDISDKMLAQVKSNNESTRLIQADACKGLPLASSCADLVTERMMLHDLEAPGKAIQEAWRILKPGSTFIACEYVVDLPSEMVVKTFSHFEGGRDPVPLFGREQYSDPKPEIVNLLRRLFTLKHEPDRHLWTGQEFSNLIEQNCSGISSTELHYSLKRWDVANWLEKSGFPIEECKQQAIIQCLAADSQVKKAWPLTISMNGEIVPEVYHGVLLQAYSGATSSQREEMKIDAHFYAAFANVTVEKSRNDPSTAPANY